MLTQKRRRTTRGHANDFELSLAELQAQERSIDTNRDALQYVQSVIKLQVRIAAITQVEVGQQTEGDRSARLAFLSLLGLESQRTVFMEFFRQEGASGRVQPIFGSPPYPWLKKDDAVLLNASGIAHRRTNISSETLGDLQGSVLNYNTFGLEHYTDRDGLQYRVTPRASVRLDDVLFISEAVSDLAIFDTTCRVPKKIVRRTTGGRPVFEESKPRFPRLGDALTLTQSSTLSGIMRLTTSREFSAVVMKVVPRAAGAATALVQLRRTS